MTSWRCRGLGEEDEALGAAQLSCKAQALAEGGVVVVFLSVLIVSLIELVGVEAVDIDVMFEKAFDTFSMGRATL